VSDNQPGVMTSEITFVFFDRGQDPSGTHEIWLEIWSSAMVITACVMADDQYWPMGIPTTPPSNLSLTFHWKDKTIVFNFGILFPARLLFPSK